MKAIIALIAAAPLAHGWALPGLWHRPRSVDILAAPANVMPLERVKNTHPHSRLAKAVAKKFRRDTNDIEADPTSNKNVDLSFLYHTNYVGSASVGGQSFKMIVDTGSSDTWLVKNGFICTDVNDQEVAAEECYFGPAYNGDFQASVGNVAGFAIRYGDGSSLLGRAGFQDITVGGMTVKNQEIMLIDAASYLGDGTTSGTLGFSYPITTRVFSTDNESLWYPASPTHRKYDPIFTSAYKQGLTTPIFSLAMDKANGTGYLSFGGLPPVSHNSDFAKTPIRIVETDGATALASELSYYTITPDSFVYGTKDSKDLNYTNPYWNASNFPDVKKNQFPVLLDSGTTLSILPEVVVRDFARQVTRPVRRSQGNYWAHCDAKVPKFGLTIGSKTIYMGDDDLLLQDITQDFTDNGTTTTFCALGLMDILPDGPFILGDNFLNSAVTVFDVGASEIRFYPKR